MNQRTITAYFVGILLMTTPLSLARIPLSFDFPILAEIAVGIYGIFMIAAGFFVGRAERYRLLLDFYIILGIVLFSVGPPTDYIVGKQFWTTMMFVGALFIGLPTVLLLNLNQEEP